jgi:hypothetical protein
MPPFLRNSHAAGATVTKVTLSSAKTLATHYTRNDAAGQITTVASFTAGSPVLCSYTTDFRMPAVYPGAYNDSDGLDRTGPTR